MNQRKDFWKLPSKLQLEELIFKKHDRTKITITTQMTSRFGANPRMKEIMCPYVFSFSRSTWKYDPHGSILIIKHFSKFTQEVSLSSFTKRKCSRMLRICKPTITRLISANSPIHPLKRLSHWTQYYRKCREQLKFLEKSAKSEIFSVEFNRL